MLEAFLAILLVGLFLAFLYFIATKLPFMAGPALQVFGIILAVIWIVYALRRSGILAQLPIRI